MIVLGFRRLRKLARALVLGSLVTFTALGSDVAARAEATAGSPIYVMRHLPQSDEGFDSDLSDEGRAMGVKLAETLGEVRFVAIFATDTRRSRQTAAVLADPLGIVPTIYDPRQPELVIARARAAGGPALIVGHSNTAPGLAGLLGASEADGARLAQFGELGSAGPDGWQGLSLEPPLAE